MKQMQSKGIDFKGQRIYIGIDVHLRSWSVTAIALPYYKVQSTIPPSATALRSFLDCRFPCGEYIACYESGFTGFSTYYALVACGIECHVVNAADVPTTQYESVMKTDRVDSMKLARMLASGTCRDVYPRAKEELDDRAVLRLRYKTQQRIAGMKAAVKHMLHCNGVAVPERFGRKRTYWSKAFTEWLLSVELLSPTNHSIRFAVSQVEAMRQQLLLMTRHIRELSRTPRYSALFEAVYSVPGVGALTAMHLIGEVGCDVGRFPNERAFASFLGLVPTCHDSGERKSQGTKTFRCNKALCSLMVEASWKAIVHDAEFCAYYGRQRESMPPQKAIIKVARKLSHRIFRQMKSTKI